MRTLKSITIAIVGLIFFNSCGHSYYIGKPDELVLQYISCIECDITESRFANLRNYSRSDVEEIEKLSKKEYYRIITKAVAQYDLYYLEIKSDDSDAITKTDFVSLSLESYSKIKAKKISDWKLYLKF